MKMFLMTSVFHFSQYCVVCSHTKSTLLESRISSALYYSVLYSTPYCTPIDYVTIKRCSEITGQVASSLPGTLELLIVSALVCMSGVLRSISFINMLENGWTTFTFPKCRDILLRYPSMEETGQKVWNMPGISAVSNQQSRRVDYKKLKWEHTIPRFNTLWAYWPSLAMILMNVKIAVYSRRSWFSCLRGSGET